MKKLFAPILNYFESGTGEYNYQPKYRKYLKFVGLLFLLLSLISLAAALGVGQAAGFFPFIVFSVASLVCMVVGFLGSERAVAKVWSVR